MKNICLKSICCVILLGTFFLNFSNAEILQVSSKKQLLSALRTAKNGDTIFIRGGVEIDLSGEKNLILPTGVILASDRGKGQSKGALLYTTSTNAWPLFRLSHINSSIQNIRIKGPDTKIYAGEDAFSNKTAEDRKENYLKYYKQNMYGTPVTLGILVQANGSKISNCELFGWTHAAIMIKKGGSNVQVIGNYIHHNRRFGLGYGVALDEGSALIKNNKFDFNSHSVTGTGKRNTSFEVCDNTFGENHERAWAVDMHGGTDRKDGTNIAGEQIKIYNNTFFIKSSSKGIKGIVIRGIPTKESEIYNNTFYIIGDSGRSGSGSSMNARTAASKKVAVPDLSSVFRQSNAKGNIKVHGNKIIER